MNQLKHLILIIFATMVISCSSDSWLGFNKKSNLSGERIPVTEKSKDLEIDQTLNMTEVNIPPMINTSNWNNENIDSQHSNFAIKEINEPVQSFTLSSSGDLVDPSIPVIIDNILYALDSEGVITAYNFTSGEKLWSNRDIAKDKYSGIFRIFREKFTGGGLKYHDGKIYATSGLSTVICIDAQNGNNIWSIELSSPVRSIPIAVNQIVLIQTIDNKTFALNASDGKIVWSNFGIQDEVNTLSLSSLLLHNNQVITHHSSDELYSLDITTGEEIWGTNIAATNRIVSASNALINFSNHPVFDEGYIFTVNSNGILAKIDINTGNISWRKNLKLVTDIYLCGNYIYGVSLGNNLIAVNKENGTVRWIRDLNVYDKEKKKEKNLQYTLPIMIKDQLLAISNGGFGILINPINGEEIKRLRLVDNIYMRPIVADNHLVVIPNSGKIIKY